MSEQAKRGWTYRLAVILNKWTYWLSKHWLATVNTLLFIYVALPIAAPVLMANGQQGAGRAIYRGYSIFCHQMAQRSFFIYGEQPVYPREITGSSYSPIEAYTGDLDEFAGVDNNNWPAFQLAARKFLGNERMGYKIALCERDIGIYGAILFFGLLFALLRKRVSFRPLPLLVFVIVGMLPVGLDGFSQLFSYLFTPVDGSVGGWLSQLLPLRESPPLLRTGTGIWFGLMLGWLAFPTVSEGMELTRREIESKLRGANLLE